ncbi:FKBP-type peptidyl-prolyl cis-trans isomerase [Lutibacter sp.]|uniref:FKBP-type peptidyl-prolyl cis-trans isomerase n=1 Tax=Lutibacter sp. TaxID=1925666 RepID=UPI0025B96E8A|nr:FKBP-type peptidyl-prolyl cis-trans isomerase [Lutibacter sp.]MCF6181965.1 FKBP-type peptidyl-prolyl cis-trans isomerase [Lutibacter sp.]
MKVIKLSIVMAALVALSSCNQQGFTKKALKTEKDTVSYAIGIDIANKLKANFPEVDRDLFIQGVVSGIDSTDILIEPKKVDAILRSFFTKRQVKLREKKKAEALKKAEEKYGNLKKEGEKFLEENKTKKGVKVTKSGLQYIVLKEGKGDSPKATSRVKVNYKGTLIDGTEFDSSKKPVEFAVNRVIKGWTEGLQLMKVGSKYEFFIPQDLAYGAFPRKGGVIKPFSTLIFEVELVAIPKK